MFTKVGTMDITELPWWALFLLSCMSLGAAAIILEELRERRLYSVSRCWSCAQPVQMHALYCATCRVELCWVLPEGESALSA